jgi:hypothetical protein
LFYLDVFISAHTYACIYPLQVLLSFPHCTLREIVAGLAT